MVERTKGRRPKNRPCVTKGRRPKNRPAKGGTLKATWGRGEGTREPWRRGATVLCKLSRQLLVGPNEHRRRRTKSTASSTSRWVTPPHDAHRVRSRFRTTCQRDRLRQASEDCLVLPVGHGVIVLVSMSTSSQRTSMRKSRTCTFLHFPILGAELTGPHPFQASSGSIRLPRLSPCDRVGFLPTANSGLMLYSFTLQVQAQLDLLRNPTRTKSYKNDFQLLPEELVRKCRHGTFLHSVRGSPCLLRNTQFPPVPRLKTLSRVSTTTIEPRRNQNSSLIELIHNVRALCGLRLTHDGLNDFSPMMD